MDNPAGGDHPLTSTQSRVDKAIHLAEDDHPLLSRIWASEASVIDAYMTEVASDALVLDLACGTGFVTNYVAAKFGCRALGVDLVPGIITKALANYGTPRVKFMWGDMLDPHLLDKRRGAFAWIMCHHGIHYVTDMKRFLRTLHRALEEHGHLLFHYLTREFGDPPLSIAALYRTMHGAKWESYRQQLEATVTGPILSLIPQPGHWIKDHTVLLELLENNGFTVTAKQIYFDKFTIPVDADLVRAVFEAVRVLPEERQAEFVNDVVYSARRLSGEANPVVSFYTAVIVAKKVSRS